MNPKVQRDKSEHPITHYKINSISPVYANICSFFQISQDNFYNFKLKYGNRDKYTIIDLIGNGKYSDVFFGHCRRGWCAIKVLKSVDFWKVQRELYILDRLKNFDHIIHVLDVVRDPDSDIISIVTEFCPNSDWKTLYPQLSMDEIRYYMYYLLQTLDHVHSKGIMHRDIKPLNFLIDKKHNKCCLIDFGLADLYIPYKQYTVRCATMRYKSPELLLNYHFYDYSLDIWGAGCIFAEMLIRPIFIKGNTTLEVLESVCKIWGKQVFLDYINKYGMDLLPELDQVVKSTTNDTSSWEDIFNEMRPNFRSLAAFDLLKKMLTVDHGERITARDALKHPFFSG